MGGKLFSKQNTNTTISKREANQIFKWLKITFEKFDIEIFKIGGLVNPYHKGTHSDIDIVGYAKKSFKENCLKISPCKNIFVYKDNNLEFTPYYKKHTRNYYSFLVYIRKYNYNIQLDLSLSNNKENIEVIKWLRRGKWFEGIITRLAKLKGMKLSVYKGMLTDRNTGVLISKNLDEIVKLLGIKKDIKNKTELIEQFNGKEKFVEFIGNIMKNSSHKDDLFSIIKKDYPNILNRVMKQVYNFRNMPKIPHYNNLTKTEKEHILIEIFNDVYNNESNVMVSEKIDGYNLSFGLIDGQIFVKSKNSYPIFDESYFLKFKDDERLWRVFEPFYLLLRNLNLDKRNFEETITRVIGNGKSINNVQIFAEFVPYEKTNVIKYTRNSTIYLIDYFVNNKRSRENILGLKDGLNFGIRSTKTKFYAIIHYFLKSIILWNSFDTNNLSINSLKSQMLELTKSKHYIFSSLIDRLHETKAEGVILEIGDFRVKFVNDEFLSQRDDEWEEINSEKNKLRQAKFNIAKELNWDIISSPHKKQMLIAETIFNDGPNINPDKIILNDILYENSNNLKVIKKVYNKYLDDTFSINKLKTVKQTINYLLKL